MQFDLVLSIRATCVRLNVDKLPELFEKTIKLSSMKCPISLQFDLGYFKKGCRGFVSVTPLVSRVRYLMHKDM